MMIVVKIILGIINFTIGCLTFLWILEHYNLIEGDQLYNTPFPLFYFLITIALLVLIIISQTKIK